VVPFSLAIYRWFDYLCPKPTKYFSSETKRTCLRNVNDARVFEIKTPANPNPLPNLQAQADMDYLSPLIAISSFCQDVQLCHQYREKLATVVTSCDDIQKRLADLSTELHERQTERACWEGRVEEVARRIQAATPVVSDWQGHLTSIASGLLSLPSSDAASSGATVDSQSAAGSSDETTLNEFLNGATGNAPGDMSIVSFESALDPGGLHTTDGQSTGERSTAEQYTDLAQTEEVGREPSHDDVDLSEETPPTSFFFIDRQGHHFEDGEVPDTPRLTRGRSSSTDSSRFSCQSQAGSSSSGRSPTGLGTRYWHAVNQRSRSPANRRSNDRFCWDWNNGSACPRTCCPFKHACEMCDGGHPQVRCPRTF